MIQAAFIAALIDRHPLYLCIHSPKELSETRPLQGGGDKLSQC